MLPMGKPKNNRALRMYGDWYFFPLFTYIYTWRLVWYIHCPFSDGSWYSFCNYLDEASKRRPRRASKCCKDRHVQYYDIETDIFLFNYFVFWILLHVLSYILNIQVLIFQYFIVLRQSPPAKFEIRWAMKKGPWLFGVYRDYTIQLCGDYHNKPF